MSRKTSADWIKNASDRAAVNEGCYFDAEIGRRACDFIERFCRQSKGRWAGQPITLLDWQRDFVMRLFGWRRADGRRRFRRYYVEVAKKNGKTTLLSALSLYTLIADDDGPEVYVNACDRDQASMLFDEAARMVRSSPDLAKRLEVVDSRKTIVFPARNGRMRANSAEAGSKDGLNPSHTIFDELHRQPDRELWEVFEYAGVARLEPLLGSITTAGEEESGVWFEQREYAEKVNAGVIEDTTFLGLIYRAMPDDDIDDPATWRKANPSMGATIDEDDFRRELREAKESPVKLANFRRLRLNIVSRASGLFVDLANWDACPGPKGATGAAYAGLDLSSVSDLTSLAIVVGDPDSGFDVLMRFWLPEDNLASLSRRDRVNYQAWADHGFLRTTPGNVIDYAFVRQEINDLAAEYEIRKLLVDPYNATKLAGELKEQDGLPVEFIRQGFLSLSAPTKELARLVLAGKIRHGGHPILRWNVSNAVAETDAAGNIKISKRKSRQKIDGVAALVNAVAAATNEAEDGHAYTAERGLIVI